MRKALVTITVVALALAVAPHAFAAPTAIATQVQLRGHHPDLGTSASLRVFLTAASYDAFHTALGEADIFPRAAALPMSFERQILVLYARGLDSGGRCLTARGSAPVSGDAVNLDLAWVDGTCGAPASAVHPFVLVSMSRTGNDGSAWTGTLRSICGAAPGVDGSRSCASIAAAPAPATAAPSAPASAPPVSAAPSPAPLPIDPGRAVDDFALALAAVRASALVTSIGWLGLGLILGVFLTAVYSRMRRRSRTGSFFRLAPEPGRESAVTPSPSVES